MISVLILHYRFGKKKLQKIKAAFTFTKVLILMAFKREDGIQANKRKSVESSS